MTKKNACTSELAQKKHIKHVTIISNRYLQDDEQKGGTITRDNACNTINTKSNDQQTMQIHFNMIKEQCNEKLSIGT